MNEEVTLFRQGELTQCLKDVYDDFSRAKKASPVTLKPVVDIFLRKLDWQSVYVELYTKNAGVYETDSQFYQNISDSIHQKQNWRDLNSGDEVYH